MSNDPKATNDAYPDMRKKTNKAQYNSASNRDKVVPRNPAKAHPASMKPTTKSKGA